MLKARGFDTSFLDGAMPNADAGRAESAVRQNTPRPVMPGRR
jgi:hypothetical protein